MDRESAAGCSADASGGVTHESGAWTLSRHPTARETCRVLAHALQRRRPPRGLIFHSDRGTEYMGAAFCAFVTRHRLEQSASVRGPSDNAPNRTQYMRYYDARRCIRR